MRNDYKIILDLIPENSKVLDIGCSDGDLISLLADKNISAQGVELNQEKVISCLGRGLDVIHGDINLIVEDFPYNQFDYCILTQTIQAVQKPDVLLNTLKKVSKNIVVGNDCMIAPFAYIVDSNHLTKKDIPMNAQGVEASDIIIDDDVWVGTGVKILPGVRINEGSVIAAGSVVNSDIPKYTIVAGSPAKVIGERT